MAETPEIPEAKDPFDKKVAVTIAMMAVILSFIANTGDDAKTEAILKTNKATNAWGYFQAKSIKQSICESEKSTLTLLAHEGDKSKIESEIKTLDENIKRYKLEKDEVKSNAEKLVEEGEHCNTINQKCDRASLLLQIAIVISSVSILAGWKPLWLAGMAVGLAGAVVGALAFIA